MLKKIAITLPGFFDGEADVITRLLRSEGYWRVHIRKPGASDRDVEQLINKVAAELRSSLSVHYHHAVALATGCGGIHLNASAPCATTDWHGMVSRSLHSIEEIGMMPYDYAFLSPVYDSISKPGYTSCFSLDKLRGIVDSRIFALGGVTPDKFSELTDIGFGGAAMLSAAWRPHIENADFSLQLITHPRPGRTVVQEAEAALRGGCRWIQLRHKDADTATLTEEGRSIRQLCDRYGATFIIDDHVELVETIGADGVHLGKNDMPVNEARRSLGPHKIIGATANTAADIFHAARLGADYIGLGPMRFTTTKEKLSAVLGIEGYAAILKEITRQGIHLPVVAIGGLNADDIPALTATGVRGVAISGAITAAPDPVTATQLIVRELRAHLSD